MKFRLEKKWIFVVPAFLGLGLILLAVFAAQLGIDHNVIWGGKRMVTLALGICLSLSSLLLHRARQDTNSPKDHASEPRAGLIWIGSGFCALFVITVYVWFVSLGRWTAWPATGYRYDRLATAFLHGQLNIDAHLDPALPRLLDPYDPEARKEIQGLDEITDMSLYNGKIYLYFGAAPALMLTAVKLLYPGQVGDGTLTFAFVSGLFIFESLLILVIWRRFFADTRGWTIILGLLVAGLMHPVPWILTQPRTYEAAVAAGQFFLVGGFYFALTGLGRSSPSNWRLVLAGAFWAFAVGTRAILVFPVVFLTIMVLHRMGREAHESREARTFFRPFLAMTLPLVMGAIVIGWYNWARFGSILETGLRYQLGMADLNRYYGDIFSLVHVPPNLYIYLINPPGIGDVFPFIRPIRAEGIITYFNNSFPVLYNAERITGIVYSTPFLLFAVIPAMSALAHLVQKRQKPTSSENIGGEQGLLQWTVLSMTGSFALALISLLLYFYGTVRYLLEIMPFADMLAMIGFWQGYQALTKKPLFHAAYASASIGLATASILSGVFLSFSSSVQRIRLNSPDLLARLILFFAMLIKRFGF